MRYFDKQTDRNRLLNFLKGIACIGIIFIHVTFPGLVGKIIGKAAQFGVPLFIMIAGWYSYNAPIERIQKRIFKMIKILLHGVVLFFSYSLLVQLKNGNSIEWLSSIFTLKEFIKLFVFCTIDFAVPLWYLIAMIETYLLWSVLLNYKLEEWVLKFIPILIVARIAVIGVCETYNVAWFWKVNFILCSFVFFLIGYALRKYRNIVSGLNNKLVIIAVVVGLIIAELPVFIQFKFDFSCIGIMLYATAIFVVGVKNPSLNVPDTITFIGEELSLDIYILHVPIAGLLVFVVNMVWSTNVWYQWVHPVITAIATVLISWIIYVVRNTLSVAKVHHYN